MRATGLTPGCLSFGRVSAARLRLWQEIDVAAGTMKPRGPVGKPGAYLLPGGAGEPPACMERR